MLMAGNVFQSWTNQESKSDGLHKSVGSQFEKGRRFGWTICKETINLDVKMRGGVYIWFN